MSSWLELRQRIVQGVLDRYITCHLGWCFVRVFVSCHAPLVISTCFQSAVHTLCVEDGIHFDKFEKMAWIFSLDLYSDQIGLYWI